MDKRTAVTAALAVKGATIAMSAMVLVELIIGSRKRHDRLVRGGTAAALWRGLFGYNVRKNRGQLCKSNTLCNSQSSP